MLYDLGMAVVDLPEDLRDETVHRFADDRADEALTVTVEQVSAGTPASLLAKKMEAVSLVYSGAVQFGPVHEVQTRVGSAANVCGTVTPHNPIYTCMAYVGAPPAWWFLQWVGTRSAPDLFDHALRSLSTPEEKLTAAPGFVRRCAGRVSLDAPEGYSAPNAFRFSLKSIVLEISVGVTLRFDVPRAEDAAYVPNGPVLLEQSDGPENLQLGGGEALSGSWVFGHYDDRGTLVERTIVRQATIHLGASTFVRVRGRSGLADWARLTEVWRDLMASIRGKAGA